MCVIEKEECVVISILKRENLFLKIFAILAILNILYCGIDLICSVYSYKTELSEFDGTDIDSIDISWKLFGIVVWAAALALLIGSGKNGGNSLERKKRIVLIMTGVLLIATLLGYFFWTGRYIEGFLLCLFGYWQIKAEDKSLAPHALVVFYILTAVSAVQAAGMGSWETWETWEDDGNGVVRVASGTDGTEGFFGACMILMIALFVLAAILMFLAVRRKGNRSKTAAAFCYFAGLALFVLLEHMGMEEPNIMLVLLDIAGALLYPASLLTLGWSYSGKRDTI